MTPALASGGGGASLTYNYVATVTPNNAGALNSPVTFAGANIGTASSDRIVVVTFGNYKAASSASGDFSAVCVAGVAPTCTGGVALAKAAGGTGTVNRTDVEIWWGLVTNVAVPGTTANISVAFSSGFVDSIAPMVGIITGSATASVSSTQVATPPAYP